MVAATTRAAARKASPSPSRRCASSRSRALLPKPRAPKPTACAATIHIPATSRPSQPARIRIGSAVRCGRRPAVPRERPWPAGRFLPGPERFGPGRFFPDRFWPDRFWPDRFWPDRLCPDLDVAFLLWP